MAEDSTLHIRVSSALKQELEKLAEIYSIKLSNVVRLALEEFAYKDNETTTTSIAKINTDNF